MNAFLGSGRGFAVVYTYQKWKMIALALSFYRSMSCTVSDTTD